MGHFRISPYIIILRNLQVIEMKQILSGIQGNLKHISTSDLTFQLPVQYVKIKYLIFLGVNTYRHNLLFFPSKFGAIFMILYSDDYHS